MKWPKLDWRVIYGGVSLCLALTFKVIDWIGIVDLILTRSTDPSWIGDTLNFIISNLDVISTILFIVGFGLFLWNERNRSAALFLARKDLPSPAPAIGDIKREILSLPIIRKAALSSDQVIRATRFNSASKMVCELESLIDQHRKNADAYSPLVGMLDPKRKYLKYLDLLGENQTDICDEFQQIENGIKGDAAYLAIKDGEPFTSPERKQEWHIEKAKYDYLLEKIRSLRGQDGVDNFLREVSQLDREPKQG